MSWFNEQRPILQGAAKCARKGHRPPGRGARCSRCGAVVVAERATSPAIPCPEFAGCRQNYCAYPGEEACFWELTEDERARLLQNTAAREKESK